MPSPFVAERMSTTSLQHFASSYPTFPSGPQSNRMSQSQTPGLDTLAEGSQYALEQLQLSRESAASNPRTSSAVKSSDHHYADENQHNDFRNPAHRNALAESRSAIRKNSSAAPIRRRISRACDQCNQLRTKCDGQNPCAHCIGRDASIPVAQQN